MKILLPVDGSDYTKRMLSYLGAHDELLGPGHDYIALNVVTPIPRHAASYLDRSSIDDYHREEAARVLQPVEAFAQEHGWRLETAYAAGHAAETIAARAAAEKVDLIVMGTHGHSALGGIILGSVASGVLARCKVPVLLVR
jgi:nucleotide-binding universal stress UspA family protein